MRASKKTTSIPRWPHVVGTVHSLGALKHALRLKQGSVEFLELRVDHFTDDPAGLLKTAPRLSAPLIVTVRHPAEGGSGALSFSQRRDLYLRFLPMAAFIDVEVRSVEKLSDVIEEAQTAGVGVIVSDHHFRRLPTGATLAERFAAAQAAGADIVKVAGQAARPADVALLLGLLQLDARQLVSVMGMGPLGKASRLLFARGGSVLNYGYLDQPQVPGQWPALLLKERIEEVLTD